MVKLQMRYLVECCVVFNASACLLVTDVLVKVPVTIALATVEENTLFQQLHHPLIGAVHFDVLLLAHCAGVRLLSIFTLVKALEASFAGTSGAAWTLLYFLVD